MSDDGCDGRRHVDVNVIEKPEMQRQASKNVKYKPVDGGTDPAGAARVPGDDGRATPRTIIWRLSNAAMVVFFLMASVVQINDPDPYIWIPIYLIPAFLCTAVICNPDITDNMFWRALCIIHIAFAIGGAIYLTVVVVQLMLSETKNPLVYEEGRELAGLLIVACWLAVCRFHCSAGGQRGLTSVLLVLCCILGIGPLFFWALCFIGPLHASLSHCAAMESAASITANTN